MILDDCKKDSLRTKTYGDGNCGFRTLLLCCGLEQNMHLELRKKTAICFKRGIK